MTRTLEEVNALRASFEVAAKPLIKWLAENVHPHHYAIVQCNRAELVEGQVAIVTDEYIED